MFLRDYFLNILLFIVLISVSHSKAPKNSRSVDYDSNVNRKAGFRYGDRQKRNANVYHPPLAVANRNNVKVNNSQASQDGVKSLPELQGTGRLNTVIPPDTSKQIPSIQKQPIFHRRRLIRIKSTSSPVPRGPNAGQADITGHVVRNAENISIPTEKAVKNEKGNDISNMDLAIDKIHRLIFDSPPVKKPGVKIYPLEPRTSIRVPISTTTPTLIRKDQISSHPNQATANRHIHTNRKSADRWHMLLDPKPTTGTIKLKNALQALKSRTRHHHPHVQPHHHPHPYHLHNHPHYHHGHELKGQPPAPKPKTNVLVINIAKESLNKLMHELVQSGLNVKFKEDPCLSSPCLNGGKCHRDITRSFTKYTCTCFFGYDGTRCQNYVMNHHVYHHHTSGLVVFIIIGIIVAILSCCLIHACRVWMRRSDLKYNYKNLSKGGLDPPDVPTSLELWNQMCLESFCGCFGHNSFDKYGGKYPPVVTKREIDELITTSQTDRKSSLKLIRSKLETMSPESREILSQHLLKRLESLKGATPKASVMKHELSKTNGLSSQQLLKKIESQKALSPKTSEIKHIPSGTQEQVISSQTGSRQSISTKEKSSNQSLYQRSPGPSQKQSYSSQNPSKKTSEVPLTESRSVNLEQLEREESLQLLSNPTSTHIVNFSQNGSLTTPGSRERVQYSFAQLKESQTLQQPEQQFSRSQSIQQSQHEQNLQQAKHLRHSQQTLQLQTSPQPQFPLFEEDQQVQRSQQSLQTQMSRANQKFLQSQQALHLQTSLLPRQSQQSQEDKRLERSQQSLQSQMSQAQQLQRSQQALRLQTSPLPQEIQQQQEDQRLQRSQQSLQSQKLQAGQQFQQSQQVLHSQTSPQPEFQQSLQSQVDEQFQQSQQALRLQTSLQPHQFQESRDDQRLQRSHQSLQSRKSLADQQFQQSPQLQQLHEDQRLQRSRQYLQSIGDQKFQYSQQALQFQTSLQPRLIQQSQEDQRLQRSQQQSPHDRQSLQSQQELHQKQEFQDSQDTRHIQLSKSAQLDEEIMQVQRELFESAESSSSDEEDTDGDDDDDDDDDDDNDGEKGASLSPENKALLQNDDLEKYLVDLVVKLSEVEAAVHKLEDKDGKVENQTMEDDPVKDEATYSDDLENLENTLYQSEQQDFTPDQNQEDHMNAGTRINIRPLHESEIRHYSSTSYNPADYNEQVVPESDSRKNVKRISLQINPQADEPTYEAPNVVRAQGRSPENETITGIDEGDKIDEYTSRERRRSSAKMTGQAMYARNISDRSIARGKEQSLDQMPQKIDERNIGDDLSRRGQRRSSMKEMSQGNLERNIDEDYQSRRQSRSSVDAISQGLNERNVSSDFQSRVQRRSSVNAATQEIADISTDDSFASLGKKRSSKNAIKQHGVNGGIVDNDQPRRQERSVENAIAQGMDDRNMVNEYQSRGQRRSIAMTHEMVGGNMDGDYQSRRQGLSFQNTIYQGTGEINLRGEKTITQGIVEENRGHDDQFRDQGRSIENPMFERIQDGAITDDYTTGIENSDGNAEDDYTSKGIQTSCRSVRAKNTKECIEKNPDNIEKVRYCPYRNDFCIRSSHVPPARLVPNRDPPPYRTSHQFQRSNVRSNQRISGSYRHGRDGTLNTSQTEDRTSPNITGESYIHKIKIGLKRSQPYESGTDTSDHGNSSRENVVSHQDRMNRNQSHDTWSRTTSRITLSPRSSPYIAEDLLSPENFRQEFKAHARREERSMTIQRRSQYYKSDMQKDDDVFFEPLSEDTPAPKPTLPMISKFLAGRIKSLRPPCEDADDEKEDSDMNNSRNLDDSGSFFCPTPNSQMIIKKESNSTSVSHKNTVGSETCDCSITHVNNEPEIIENEHDTDEAEDMDRIFDLESQGKTFSNLLIENKEEMQDSDTDIIFKDSSEVRTITSSEVHDTESPKSSFLPSSRQQNMDLSNPCEDIDLSNMRQVSNQKCLGRFSVWEMSGVDMGASPNCDSDIDESANDNLAETSMIADVGSDVDSDEEISFKVSSLLPPKHSARNYSTAGSRCAVNGVADFQKDIRDEMNAVNISREALKNDVKTGNNNVEKDSDVGLLPNADEPETEETSSQTSAQIASIIEDIGTLAEVINDIGCKQKGKEEDDEVVMDVESNSDDAPANMDQEITMKEDTLVPLPENSLDNPISTCDVLKEEEITIPEQKQKIDESSDNT